MTQRAQTVSGSRTLGMSAHQRRPDTFAPRDCWCGKRISRYNPNPTCYSHTKPKKPILRGVRE